MQVVVHACHPCTRKAEAGGPRVRGQPELRGRDTILIPYPDSKPSVRMLRQASISLCPATLPAITTHRSPRCHLLVDTREKGNYRAHRGPRPRRAEDGWGTTDCSRARNRQQPALTASTTPKTKVRAQRSQLTLSKRAGRELPVPVFGPVRGSPQSQSLRFRVATETARLRDKRTLCGFWV